MWTLFVLLAGDIGVMVWAHDPRVDEAHRKFYGKYY